MDISTLIGKTLTECYGSVGDDVISFTTTEGKTYRLCHYQDCCESVSVEDICGDLSDLVGLPIVQAEENSSNDDPPGIIRDYPPESQTWTFYRLATANGSVVIRWYGSSNGYYSERVDFEEVAP